MFLFLSTNTDTLHGQEFVLWNWYGGADCSERNKKREIAEIILEIDRVEDRVLIVELKKTAIKLSLLLGKRLRLSQRINSWWSRRSAYRPFIGIYAVYHGLSCCIIFDIPLLPAIVLSYHSWGISVLFGSSSWSVRKQLIADRVGVPEMQLWKYFRTDVVVF